MHARHHGWDLLQPAQPCPHHVQLKLILWHAFIAQIVAGLEPENTNVFLQMLGEACRVGNAADVVQVRG